jgi:acyl carrier protein
MTDDVLAELKQLIAKDLDVNLTVEEIDENASLMEDGLGFDSIVIVEFISLIEDHFGFEFEDDKLSVASFQNLAVLANVVAAHLHSVENAVGWRRDDRI